MPLKIQRKLIDGSHHLFMKFTSLIKTHGEPSKHFNPTSDQFELSEQRIIDSVNSIDGNKNFRRCFSLQDN